MELEAGEKLSIGFHYHIADTQEKAMREVAGMYGMFAIQESIRQVRGEASHQVPNVRVSFCQGVGGMFMAAGSLVFTNEDPY